MAKSLLCSAEQPHKNWTLIVMNLNGTLIFRHNLTWVYEGEVVETTQLLNLDIKGWLVLAGEGLCLGVPGVEVPVEPRHVAAAEAELARGVATARVQAPAAPRRVQSSTGNIINEYFY